jgi:hypothetical protein
MKRILITRINGRFDERLIEYFISQQYNVRILADFIDPGCAWLKWPLEIYSCSPHDKEEFANAVKGCDFVIATHCNPFQGPGKNSAMPVLMIAETKIPDFSRLKSVVYLKEIAGAGGSGKSRKQRKCIKDTISVINQQIFDSKSGNNKMGIRSIFVDAVRAISEFESNDSESNCFENLAKRIHEIMTQSGNKENSLLDIKNDDRQISWKIVVRSWFETGIDRILQLMRLPHNLTGL